ncbi:ABC transporter substrate-binding protein [Lysinimonas soli]|uniref:ABC transporter substrate-binding protein n=1 Tax=Lysinimonas soli TaxID=1074233 RepID=A0ABW0NNH3_9MICO
MSKDARNRRKLFGIAIATTAVLLTAACSGTGSSGSSAGGKVTIEFSQWWEPELPAGALKKLVGEFETANPNITVKLISGPYTSIQDQTTTAVASGTMADVVGLDGAWVADLVKQGGLDNLSKEITSSKYDASQLSSQVKISGSTYMIPVVNFVYPMFTNDDLLAKAGVSSPPTTQSEFLSDAKAVSALGGPVKGWILPLGTTNPNGVQNDIMSWLWASGGSMLKNGQPDLTNSKVADTVNFVKSLSDAKAIAAGAATLQETDKVTQFTNGQVGMMIDSLAHIDTIKKANPNLKFSISAIPAADGYSGKRGIPYASWGIGVSNKSEHKAEAWKLVEFLMSKKTNSTVSTLAHGFPGNTTSTPDFSGSDPLYAQAFKIYQAGYPANEFVGLPVADQLMRDFDVEFQKVLAGDESVSAMLKNTQTQWKAKF